MDWINLSLVALGIIVTVATPLLLNRFRVQQNKIDQQDAKVADLARQMEQRVRDEAIRIEGLSTERRAHLREIIDIKIENTVLKAELAVCKARSDAHGYTVGGLTIHDFINRSGESLAAHARTKP